MTQAEIIDKINLYIYENTTEDISGDRLNEILIDVANFVVYNNEANYRNSIASLIPGTNQITFASTLGTDGYSYTMDTPYVYDNDGNNVDCKVTDRTANGFKITVPIACTLNYKATLI